MTEPNKTTTAPDAENSGVISASLAGFLEWAVQFHYWEIARLYGHYTAWLKEQDDG